MPAAILLLLLAAQVTLGVLTVLLRKPADVASAHVAVGALVLMTSFVLTARAGRLGHHDRAVVEQAFPAACFEWMAGRIVCPPGLS